VQYFDAFVHDLVVGPDMTSTILNLGITIFVIFVIRAAAKYLGNITSTRLEEGIMKSIRDALFARVASLSMDFFARKRSGEIISVLMNDVGVLNMSTVNSISQLWRETTTVTIYLAILVMISAKLTVMAILIASIGAFFVRASTSYLRRYAQRMQAAQADYTTTLQESLQGIRIVKGMGLESIMSARFAAQTAQYVRSSLKNTRVIALVPPVNELFGIAAIVAVFYVGGIALGNGEITPSNLMRFLFLLFGLMQPISIIVNVVTTMQRGLVAANNVLAILDQVPAVQSGDKVVSTFTSNIAIDHVTFAYERDTVLKDVSFALPRGQTVALVGASGSGKSTILDLLLRFYDPSAGTIRIDGTDIRDISTDAYRRMFGTVSQETVLFNDTVTRNIALGEATPDIARVEQVARIAHAHEFITAMPEGYQTTIGDRGIKLSGGQRQRLAIARALYRDPDILLFDEATSALDTSSERIVQEAINDVLAGRTAVVVAHRLSTIINADIILVFDQGHIVERGTHTELLAAQGTYAKLYDLQFGTDHASGQ
jgi:ATP-binding cassette subfamily B protein/subfamily B ATP-binding cassette protein MsbA